MAVAVLAFGVGKWDVLPRGIRGRGGIGIFFVDLRLNHVRLSLSSSGALGLECLAVYIMVGFIDEGTCLTVVIERVLGLSCSFAVDGI